MRSSARPALGDTLAGRYRLEGELGRGGFGVVFEATDLVEDSTVALKLLPRRDETEATRTRREVAALRLLRLPGVVRFLDDGEAPDGQRFVVMEVVAGTPFPGLAGPVSWEAIRETVLSLLEALARVHDFGVVHRDLKPGNVLVDVAGRPVILDFGLSLGDRIGPESLESQGMVGTPAYLAPEQVRRSRVGPRTDVYSVAVMIFEALTGRLPHEGSSALAFLAAKLTQVAPRVREVAPHIDPIVAEAIDLSLSHRPEDRPESARALLAMLGGRQRAERDAVVMPWLGPRDAFHRVVAAIDGRNALDVVGRGGSGRTRCLDEALAAAGVTPLRVASGAAPLASLRSLVPLSAEDMGATLATALDRAEEGLAALLATGEVVVADPLEGVDGWTQQVLERCRDRGAVFRVMGRSRSAGPAVHLEPLPVEALEPLFDGPAQLLHIPEDGARLLHARTRGLPARVAAELRRWVRSGLASWRDGRVVVGRPTLERLASELEYVTSGEEAGVRDTLQLEPGRSAPPPAADFHANIRHWIQLAGANASVPLIAQAAQQPRWAVEAAVADLQRAGQVSIDGGGRLLVPGGRGAPVGWGSAELTGAHRRLADCLPAGALGRLFHLVCGGMLDQVAREAIAVARERAHAGRVTQAAGLLYEVLRIVRSSRERPGEVELLREAVIVAVAAGTEQALETACYELERAAAAPELEALSALTRVALHIQRGGGQPGLDELATLRPFTDERLELLRQTLKAEAAQGCPLEVARDVVRELCAWADARASQHALLLRAIWLGRLRYREGLYSDAARIYLDTLAILDDDEVPLARRLLAQLNAASALLEANDHGRAVALAADAQVAAAKARLPRLEAHAVWLLRHARYRAGEAQRPDLELVTAAEQLGVSGRAAVIAFGEGVIAWRSGQDAQACQLLLRASELAGKAGRTHLEADSTALAAALGAGLTTRRARELAAAARTEDPAMRVQSLGLLAFGLGEVLPEWRAEVDSLSERLAARDSRQRLDALSLDEALGYLRAPTRVGVKTA